MRRSAVLLGAKPCAPARHFSLSPTRVPVRCSGMTQPIYSQPMSHDSTASGAIRPAPSSGARLVSADGRALPLESVDLESEAGGGVARSTLRQRFRNTEAMPVEVTYLVPLPADGAVSGYSFELAGVVTCGVVEKTQLAREHYEEALMQGKSAA